MTNEPEFTITDMTITPIGWQGAAQHTWTRACDGFHEPGQCKDEAPVEVEFGRQP